MRKLMEEEKTNNEKPESESEGACGDCKRLNDSDDSELNNQTSGKTNEKTDIPKKSTTDRIGTLFIYTLLGDTCFNYTSLVVF